MQLKNLIKLQAAGSGKTWSICKEALSIVGSTDYPKRVLITTFTNKGIEAIKSEIMKQNQGVCSNLITVRSWYQFLMADLIRPYQSFILGINKIKSYDLTDRYGEINFGKKGQIKRYFSGHFNVKKDYASELACYLNEASNGLVVHRFENIYTHIFIDEFQDMAGYDLNLIDLLFNSTASVCCVGDNKQATYKTHNARSKKTSSGSNIGRFSGERQKSGKVILEENLVTRRFNEIICHFANKVFPNENNITTCMIEETKHDGVFLINHCDVCLYYVFYQPIVLKYDKKTAVDGYPSLNFGLCKGMTFDRVLIYPNGPLLKFIAGKSLLSSPAKYYVAVTRARFSIAIVVDQMPNSVLFEDVQLVLGNTVINAKRYICR